MIDHSHLAAQDEQKKQLLGYQMTIFDSSHFPFHPTMNSDNQKLMLDDSMNMMEYEYIDGPIGLSQTQSSIRLPLFGSIHYVNDVKGLCQTGFLVVYWFYGVFTTLFVILLPRYVTGDISCLPIIVYCCIAVLCISSLWRASTLSPGRLPSKESIDQQKVNENWTFCSICQRMRGPRTLHCRRCGHCVRRRDHHCPWINNCVGEDNHYAFIQLILYAYLLCATSLMSVLFHYFYFNDCHSQEACSQDVFYLNHSTGLIRGLMVTSCVLGVLMGGLTLFQHLSLLMDMTTIDWMMLRNTMEYTNNNIHNTPKRPTRKKSLRAAYSDLCGPGSVLLYWLPCRRRTAPPVIYIDEVV